MPEIMGCVEIHLDLQFLKNQEDKLLLPNSKLMNISDFITCYFQKYPSGTEILLDNLRQLELSITCLDTQNTLDKKSERLCSTKLIALSLNPLSPALLQKLTVNCKIL